MTITPESVQTLLNSQDYGDRLSGVNQLRQLDSTFAFGAIEPLINDAHVRVRYAAVSMMDTLGHIDRAKSLSLLRDRLLTDPEIDVRAAAADALAALKITEAFEDIKTVYEQSSSEWLMQLSIIAALGEMGDPRGFALLEKALTSDNDLLQTAAISSLGELGDIKAIPLLLPFADSSDWQIRYRLAQALGRLGGEEAKIVLKKLAQDQIPQVATEAQLHLGS